MTYEITDINGKPVIIYYHADAEYTREAYVGKVREGYKNKNAPDWLNLEKSLRYSALFAKAFALAKTDTAVSVGMTFFMITLVNGKSGESTETGLKFAFDNLGIVWTETEIVQINQILTDNKFSIQL